MTEVKYDIGNGHEISVEYDEHNITKITRECFEALIEKQIPKEHHHTRMPQRVYEAYKQGQADGAKKFSEWLQENVFIDTESGVTVVCGKEFTRVVGFLELYAEWQKGAKNESNNIQSATVNE